MAAPRTLPLGLALFALLGTGAVVAQNTGANKPPDPEVENPHDVNNPKRPADTTSRKTTDKETQKSEADNPHSASSYKTSGQGAGKRDTTGVNRAEVDNPASIDYAKRSDPAAVLERLHFANQSEIEASKLAQSNGTPRVKQFADMMVRDHTALDEKVTTLAGKLSVKLADTPKDKLARRMKADGEKLGSDLGKLNGEEFDRSYARAMVDGHRKMLNAIVVARGDCREKQLCALLDELRPTVEEHLRAAQQLRGPQAMGRSK
jgi:predicted outer membrane protein